MDDIGFNFLDEDMAPPVAGGPAMPTPPTPPGPMRPAVPQNMAPFLMALPLILRGRAGGMAGAAAFLQGLQQAQQMKAGQAQRDYQNQTTQFNQQRQLVSDQRAQAQLDANADWRKKQLDAQAQQRRSTALSGAVNTLMESDPEVASLLMPVLQSQLTAAGITDFSPLEQTMRVVTNPTRVEKRWAEKQLQTWEKLDENEKGRLAKATYRNPANGQDYTLDQLYQVARGVSGATATPPAKPMPMGALDAESIAAGELGLLSKPREQWTPEDYAALQAQVAKNRPRAASNDGLSPRATTQINQKQRNFEALPVVKNTQVIAEGASFANSLDPNTNNPADDQALIYAFAKAMDPNSVVREGEYATVQRYAQSWADSFGFNAQRIFSNTAFLTPQARQNMKRTIMARFRAAQGQYNAVRKSYAKEINRITGAQDGMDYLTDYGAAFPTDTPAPGSGGGAGVGASYQDYLDRKKGSR